MMKNVMNIFVYLLDDGRVTWTLVKVAKKEIKYIRVKTANIWQMDVVRHGNRVRLKLRWGRTWFFFLRVRCTSKVNKDSKMNTRQMSSRAEDRQQEEVVINEEEVRQKEKEKEVDRREPVLTMEELLKILREENKTRDEERKEENRTREEEENKRREEMRIRDEERREEMRIRDEKRDEEMRKRDEKRKEENRTREEKENKRDEEMRKRDEKRKEESRIREEKEDKRDEENKKILQELKEDSKNRDEENKKFIQDLKEENKGRFEKLEKQLADSDKNCDARLEAAKQEIKQDNKKRQEELKEETLRLIRELKEENKADREGLKEDLEKVRQELGVVRENSDKANQRLEEYKTCSDQKLEGYIVGNDLKVEEINKRLEAWQSIEKGVTEINNVRKDMETLKSNFNTEMEGIRISVREDLEGLKETNSQAFNAEIRTIREEAKTHTPTKIGEMDESWASLKRELTEIKEKHQQLTKTQELWIEEQRSLSNRPQQSGGGATENSQIADTQNQGNISPMILPTESTRTDEARTGTEVSGINVIHSSSHKLSKWIQLKTFSGTMEENPLEFLQNFRDFFAVQSMSEQEKILIVSHHLRSYASNWWSSLFDRPTTFGEFKERFLSTFWNEDRQDAIRHQVTLEKYHPRTRESIVNFFRRQVSTLKSLNMYRLSEAQIIKIVRRNLPKEIGRLLVAADRYTVEEITDLMSTINADDCEVPSEPPPPRPSWPRPREWGNQRDVWSRNRGHPMMRDRRPPDPRPTPRPAANPMPGPSGYKAGNQPKAIAKKEN